MNKNRDSFISRFLFLLSSSSLLYFTGFLLIFCLHWKYSLLFYGWKEIMIIIISIVCSFFVGPSTEHYYFIRKAPSSGQHKSWVINCNHFGAQKHNHAHHTQLLKVKKNNRTSRKKNNKTTTTTRNDLKSTWSSVYYFYFADKNTRAHYFN